MKPSQIFAGLLLLPLLYLVSVGPVVWIGSRLDPGLQKHGAAVGRCYAPLAWVADKSPTFADFLTWYANRWFHDPRNPMENDMRPVAR